MRSSFVVALFWQQASNFPFTAAAGNFIPSQEKEQVKDISSTGGGVTKRNLMKIIDKRIAFEEISF